MRTYCRIAAYDSCSFNCQLSHKCIANVDNVQTSLFSVLVKSNVHDSALICCAMCWYLTIKPVLILRKMWGHLVWTVPDNQLACKINLFSLHKWFVMPMHYTCCRRASYRWQLALLDAHRRKLVLVVQTHRPGSKLVFWNDFTFLCPTIFRITWVRTDKGGRSISTDWEGIYTVVSIKQ